MFRLKVNNNSVINRNLTAVERAAGDLRRGGIIVVKDGQNAHLVTSAELIVDHKIALLKSLSGADPLVGLTYNRANILKISPRSGDVALVKMSAHMDSGIITSMADPADDLMQLMQGPFIVADVNPSKIHDAGIKVCKIARLLPAAVFSSAMIDVFFCIWKGNFNWSLFEFLYYSKRIVCSENLESAIIDFLVFRW